MVSRASLKFQQGSKFAHVTFDFEENGGGPVTVGGQALSISQAWAAHVAVSQSSDCGLVEVTVREDTGQVGTWTGVVPGQSSASALPINCAVLVNKRCALTRRGRFYIPGILESQVTSDGMIIGVALTAWNASMLDFHAKLSVEGMDMAVKTTGVGGLVVYDDVTALEVQGQIATQRRRMRK